MANRLNTRRRIGTTASWAVLGLMLACSTEAMAQTTPATANPEEAAADTVPQDNDQNDTIVVVGSRASQQSANARKRNARTATDSIVADDIGSFPDRNVNEAISRVPGVALGRNEFGEGDSVAVRGNGPDLTRVELDGIGVQATNGLAIAPSRGADLRELPAEIIKSVDVVKGSTADMTEGSLGGTVQIKTRSGLDFKKPYLSLRVGAGQNSLGKDWTPDANLVVARKFFDDRLGIIASGSYSKLQNNGHTYENTNNRGFARLYDFDNSAEKTFAFNPDTVGTDAADVGIANSTAPGGGQLTPRQLVTLSAGATSKAQCLQIFPYTAETAASAVKVQRTLEQQTCLNQWNDATPALIRNFMLTQTDERYSFDARADYRISDQLTFFVKGTVANRKVHDVNRGRTPLTMFNANLAGTFVDSPVGTYPRIRSLSPTAPAGYYLFDPTYGLNNVSNNATVGNVLNVVPGSVVVDSEHNVTKMTLTNNSVQIDQIENRIDTKTKYGQAGFEYRGDRLDIDLWGGYTKATTSRGDMRTNRTYNYGDATITLQPNGLYDIDLPANYDDTNPANYVQLRPATAALATVPISATNPIAVIPPYTIAQQPLTTPSFAVTYSPALGESTEKIAKFDLTYKTDGMIPFIQRVKVGAMWRKNDINRWGNGGYTRTPASCSAGVVSCIPGAAGYVAAVVVPTAIVRGTYRACEPTATSAAAGGLSCNYGFVPSTNPANVRSGVDTLTPQQLRDLFVSTLQAPDSEYFGDLPNRGNLPPAWNGIRTDQVFNALGASQFINDDCLIRCTGSDGNVYDQPVTRVNETIKNVYGMFEFEQPLPLGLRFNGNVGMRGVFVTAAGSGLQTLSQIRVTATYDAANPNAAAGISTTSYAIPVTFKRSSTDWLPSVNLNLWAFDSTVVFRLYGGKTVARPNINNLVPAGTCVTYDQREELDPSADDFNCSGRVGNPGLKPFTAWNYNASLEWYVNKDTVISATYGKLDVKIGNPIAVTELRQPFAGSTEKDPVTGASLADFTFLVPTYANGPGYKRDIWEFSAKTAFTFLPSFLKHTGVDVNYSILASAVTSGLRDPNTGDTMLPPNESKYYLNASLWYDDGKFNARVAYQKRSERFNCLGPCGSNAGDINYPGEQYTNVRLVAPGYNPGTPLFYDGSTFIDAKMSYNINKSFQVYLEGRNLRREAQTQSTGKYEPFADGTPKIQRLVYGGRRVMVGARFQIK